MNKIFLGETFTCAGKIKDWRDWIKELPKEKGVYIAVYNGDKDKPEFIDPGTGGFFKGDDPNVGIKTPHNKPNRKRKEIPLEEAWVIGGDIVYIGCAGHDDNNPKPNKSTIYSRVKLYMRFGTPPSSNDKIGKPVGHKGGRYIWQIKEHKELEIWICPCKDPETKESELIEKFKTEHNDKKPFANLKDGKNVDCCCPRK